MSQCVVKQFVIFSGHMTEKNRICRICLICFIFSLRKREFSVLKIVRIEESLPKNFHTTKVYNTIPKFVLYESFIHQKKQSIGSIVGKYGSKQ